MVLPVFTFLSVLLTACSGGGGDHFNSSFEQTFTFGSQTYVCRSEKAANACGGASQDCSACELQSSSSPVITQVCAQPVANTHRVTTDGCVLRLTNDTQTGICTSEGLRLLSGINWTKQQVSAGTLFSRGSLSITVGNLTETITCN